MITKTLKKNGKVDLGEILSIILQLVLLFFVVLLLIVVFRGLRKPGITLQPFLVPQELNDRGLTGQVLGMQLISKIESMKAMANSVKADTINLLADVKPELNLEVLGVGFSTNTLLFHISDLLGIKNQVLTGNLIDLDQKFILNIQGAGFTTQTFIQPYQEGQQGEAIDSLLTKSSIYLLENTDPYRLAVWYNRINQDEKALGIIRQMIKSNHPDIAWAYIA